MIGFIGGGNMAEALIKGMTSRGMQEIIVSEPRAERRSTLGSAYGVKTTESNADVVSASSVIILAVKPQIMADVLGEIGPSIGEDKTVVSIAAGITLSFLQAHLKTSRLVRAMPNTPAMVLQGMTVLSLGAGLSPEETDLVREIFRSVGKVLVLPEAQMNAVTAVSGSGPAFVALFAEAMTDAGIAMGLGSDAAELAVQTLIGTARFLETGITPAKLREMVTSPGGTTAAGLSSFSEQKFVAVVAAALQAARARAEELGRGK